MELQELINRLEKMDQDSIVPFGFGEPMSYRGYYEQLAFDPVQDVRIGDMLNSARSALGATFTAYKGGDYTMLGETNCWISAYGESSDDRCISPTLVDTWEWIAKTTTNKRRQLLPHEQRVVDEKKELDDRTAKLNAFLGGEIYGTLAQDEKKRLCDQVYHMECYSEVLGKRIAAFGEPVTGDQLSKQEFPNGLTVAELKALIADWPETDANGEPCFVWIGSGATCASNAVTTVWPLNHRYSEDGKTEWAEILLEGA